MMFALCRLLGWRDNKNRKDKRHPPPPDRDSSEEFHHTEAGFLQAGSPGQHTLAEHRRQSSRWALENFNKTEYSYHFYIKTYLSYL